MHSLDLLLSLYASCVKSLILLLDAGDFSLYLLFPRILLVLLSLLVLSFKFANLVQFSLFFDFQQGLFDSLGEKHVQNWLDFSVVVKQVVVFDLSVSINTSLLGHVLGSGRFRDERVSLSFYILNFSRLHPLFCQKVSQVNFNSSRRKRSKVVQILVSFLVLFVLNESLFNHLDLLLFPLHLNALLFLLSWSQVVLQQVVVVSVSTEDSFVVHDVQSTSIVFIVFSFSVGVFVFLLSFNDLGLGSLEVLGHFLIYCLFNLIGGFKF